MSANQEFGANSPINRYWDCGDLIRRMRRIEGQARGIQGMLERGEECKAILTQIAAMSGALNQVARVVGACGLVEGLQEGNADLDPEQVKGVLAALYAKGQL